MADILVVDDQPELRRLIRTALEREGHTVFESATAKEAVEVVRIRDVDLVLLDVELPDRTGFDVLAQLHERSELPIIFVSGRAEERDRVFGLRMGADDYVTKPFSVHELTARVAATLRRTARPKEPEEVLSFDRLVIRPLEREVLLDERPVEMTAKEFDLLLHLARNPKRVFGRDELLRDVWRSKAEWQDPATVTEHIRRLRAKLEDNPSRPRRLETVRGAGYRFVP